MKLAYNGAGFHGWQRQPNVVSVQQVLEEALSVVCGCNVEITGAGRTDTGVHAACMFAHFDLSEIPDTQVLIKSLNQMIGKNISVFSIFPVADDAHARFDAVSRTYKYFISYDKSPFMYPFCCFSHKELDLDGMNRAAELLLSTDDFTSFAKLHSDNKTNICKVTEAFWSSIPIDDKKYSLPGFNGIVFTITADRFLRNMVRAVVGTLVDVGSGKLSLQRFQDIINIKDRCKAGTSMPPQGLFLWNVAYPYIN